MFTFLATLLLAVVPTIEVSSTPVQPGLPDYVMSMTDTEYQAWAIWQNGLARGKAERDARYGLERPTYTVSRTTVDTRNGGRLTGRSNGVTRRYTDSGKGYSSSTTTRNATTNRSRSGWSKLESATVPTRYKNPYYCPKPLTVYNPYCRIDSGREPDWNNLFVEFEGDLVTIGSVLKKLDRPLPPEWVYTLLMQVPNVIGTTEK